ATRSDTEVILRQLVARGDAGLDEVNGMYALAWLNASRREITLAVDPVGIKPLYVAMRAQWMAFASELGSMLALLRSMGETPALPGAGVANYLARGWIDARHCALDGVTKLLPGEIVRLRRDGTLSRRVRELPAAEPGLAALDDAALVARARDVTELAV